MVMITFAVTITVVYFIHRLKADYSWIIAIVSGSILDALVLIIAFAVLKVDYSIVALILGHLAAIAVGMILHLFVFSVDYSATELVQFEDDDYYYYVKAVPKVSVKNKDVRVKKINTRNVSGSFHVESFEDE